MPWYIRAVVKWVFSCPRVNYLLSRLNTWAVGMVCPIVLKYRDSSYWGKVDLVFLFFTYSQGQEFNGLVDNLAGFACKSRI